MKKNREFNEFLSRTRKNRTRKSFFCSNIANDKRSDLITLENVPSSYTVRSYTEKTTSI